MKKVLILETPQDTGYYPLFPTEEFEVTIIQSPTTDFDYETLKEYDLVLLTGGEDVSLALYNGVSFTFSQDKDYAISKRDTFEIQVIDFCLRFEIPVVGICRGFQLLCIHQGGSLIQHVEGHSNCNHDIMWLNGGTITSVAGDHHQMCIMDNSAKVIALATGGRTNLRVTEPEAAIWPEKKLFGVQFHPEWMSPNKLGRILFNQQVSLLLEN